MKKILIFGSCVSRDPFEDFVNSDLGFIVNDYYARTSFASISGAPILGEDLSKIASPFQRRMVHQDFSKNFIDYDFSTIDLIVFDFIDDRFALLELPDGASCTESDEFKKSDLNFRSNRISPFSEEFFNRWENGWNRILEKLIAFDILDRVVINNVLLAEVDNSGVAFEGRNYISRFNSWLHRVYSRLKIDIPEKQFCNYSSTFFVGDSRHKWGRSPFHFDKSVNKAFMNYLTQHRIENECCRSISLKCESYKKVEFEMLTNDKFFDNKENLMQKAFLPLDIERISKEAHVLQPSNVKLNTTADLNGVIHENGKFGAQIYFSIDDEGLLRVSVKTVVNSTELDFCYYLIRNDFRMHTTAYEQGKSEFCLRIVQPAKYSIRVFIKFHGQHFSHADSYTTEFLEWVPNNFIKISIVIPVYNREEVIHRCLNSIYSQTLPENNYEVVLVVDCSTDSTSRVINEYCEIHNNIRLIRLPKNTGGASTPRNIGLEYAKGEYVFFLDSDYEILSNTLLSDAYRLSKEQDLDICLIYGYRNVPETSPRPIGKYRMRRPIMDCLNVMKRTSLNKVNPRFYDFMGTEDVIFVLQFLFNSESFRVNWLPGKLIAEMRQLRQGSPRSNEKWREMIEAFVDVSFAQLAQKPYLADGVYYAYAALAASLPHIEMKYRQVENIPMGQPTLSMNYVSQNVLNFLSAYLNYRVPENVEDCLEPSLRDIFKLLRSSDRPRIVEAFGT